VGKAFWGKADLVSARKILWQLVNKPQLAGSSEQVRPRTLDGWRKNQQSQKQISSRKFMQNYFVKFALRHRHRPFF